MNTAILPAYVTDLIVLYGPPSQAGFGSAVFYEPAIAEHDLESVALKCYRHFVGDLWERFGEAAWLGAWKLAYTRSDDQRPDVVAELGAIAQQDVAGFVPVLLLADGPDGEKAQHALAAAYDDPAVSHMRVYTIGDGAALSGLLIAGYRLTHDATILISLLD